MSFSAASAPGTPKLWTCRVQLPAPRSSTGTSSRRITAAGSGWEAGASATATRPSPRRTTRVPAPAYATSAGPSNTLSRPRRAKVSRPSGPSRATPTSPESGTIIRSTGRAGRTRSASPRTPTRRPVCCQPGVAAGSTMTSQPSERSRPSGRNQGFGLSIECSRSSLLAAREAEVDAAVPGVQPPRGDRLLPGVEGEAVGPVRLRVAEQRVLESAERVVGDRDRDRHVDPDHADLDLPLEAARRPAVVREHRGAVPEGARVDEGDALLEARDAHDGQDRPEDLVAVHPRRGRDTVDQGGAEPEAVRGPVGFDVAPVDDHVGAVARAQVDVGGDPVPVLPGDEGPHVAPAAAVADPQGADPLGDPGDEVVRDRLHDDEHADRHASLA